MNINFCNCNTILPFVHHNVAKPLISIMCQSGSFFATTYENIQNMLSGIKKIKIDPDYLCPSEIYDRLLPDLEKNISITEPFDTKEFLAGHKASKPKSTNTSILRASADYVSICVDLIAKEQNLSLEKAYKMFIGTLDEFDKKLLPLSTFALRSAVLLSGLERGVTLESWMVYTKGGKPTNEGLWPFLDQWKNWVPEAQGAMLKSAVAMLVKSRSMASINITNENTNNAIVFKGGFGAGKTRLANILMGDSAAGVVGPDTCKNIVRRAMPSVTHSAAHIQGSQIAYKFFDELITKKIGPIVYDSSLSNPNDIRGYLKKCKDAKRKLVVYDVSRFDVSRVLSVLKRSVGGEDPRISPDVIVNSAINDKLSRVECMNVIFNDNTKDAAIQPEYHLMMANKRGWDGQEVMTLKSNHQIEFKHPEAHERLMCEGIKFDAKQFNNLNTREALTAYFGALLEKPVKDVMTEISQEEKDSMRAIFESRKIVLESKKISSPQEFYEALNPQFKRLISQQAIEDAFAKLKPETAQAFFKSLEANPCLTYLDLPLRTALAINYLLQGDPWV